MALASRQIITVTAGGILYRNSEQVVSWIDFRRCHVNWLASRQDTTTAADKRCVGIHDTAQAVWLDVEFYTEPRIRFEFRSYALRDTLLFHPMQSLGDWYTCEAR